VGLSGKVGEKQIKFFLWEKDMENQSERDFILKSA
jgi:hypothetical protein